MFIFFFSRGKEGEFKKYWNFSMRIGWYLGGYLEALVRGYFGSW